MIAFLRRWRAWLTIVPLVAGVAVAATVGAHLLWNQPASADQQSVTCWNGAHAVRADCGHPTGEAGLAWVFPGLNPDRPSCTHVKHAAQPGHPVPFEISCSHVISGQQVTVTYSVRTSVAAGVTYLTKQYHGAKPSRSAATGRMTWRSTGRGPALVTVAYQAYPYSVTVQASTAQVRDHALASLVHFRAADQIDVRSAS